MAENLESIIDTGDVITEQIDLTARGTTVNLKNFVMQTVVYEDMFSNTMSASLLVRDAANLINRLTFSGVETVRIKFRTPGFSDQGVIEKKFYISNIESRRIGEKDQAYVLSLISFESIIDNNSKISKKFSGRTDVLVRSIFDEYIKDEKNLRVFSNNSSTTTFVSPYWTPFKMINWLSNRSYDDSFSSVPNYFFYEGSKNFYFTSIDRLSKADSYSNFYFLPASDTSEYDLPSRYELIKGMTDVPHFDVFRAQDYGYYANKLITHDITLKQYKEFNHDHYEYRNRIKGMENNVPFPKNVPRNYNNFRTVRTKQFGMFDNSFDPKFEVWANRRNSLIYEANNLSFTIKVHGRTDIEVGKMVDLYIPKSTAKDSSVNTDLDTLFDPYLSGKYLITSIRHQFTLNKHEMLLEIMKDSFQESIG